MIHENLRNARKIKGLTQKQIAELLAMEQTTFSKKERGISPIRNDEWIRFAKILEVDIELIRDQSLKLHNIKNDANLLIVSKKVFEDIINYNAKLEEENQSLKDKLKKAQ